MSTMNTKVYFYKYIKKLRSQYWFFFSSLIMLLSFFWTLRIIFMVSYSNWNSYKKISIISLHFYTNVLLLIIFFIVKMHFYKHVFNVFQKKSSFISSISYHYPLIIFTRFLRVCWDLILRYIMYTFFNTIIFFYLLLLIQFL